MKISSSGLNKFKAWVYILEMASNDYCSFPESINMNKYKLCICIIQRGSSLVPYNVHNRNRKEPSSV